MDDLVLPDLDSLAGRVPDGAKVAIVKNKSGVPMAAVRALIRRGVKDLHVVGVPTSGLPIDMLVGAGCVADGRDELHRYKRDRRPDGRDELDRYSRPRRL